jgi:formylglycine-generating enzyme required for sulfatase activity
LTKRTDDVDAGTADASNDGGATADVIPESGSDVAIPTTRRSCLNARTKCGLDFDIDCCASSRFDGGTFPMGRSVGGSDDFDNVPLPNDQPEHLATVAPFELALFETTIGRFSAFVADKLLPRPHAGDGAIPGVPGTGWREEWNFAIPFYSSELVTSLLQCGALGTFPEEKSSDPVSDTLPVNCVNWYEALAFCIWDGGRLPSEAEWEFAAANGDDNRRFPWGDEAGQNGCFYANLRGCNMLQGVRSVGWYEPGRAAAGQFDMTGNVAEFVFDQLASYTSDDCSNCVIVPPQVSSWNAVVRGGDFSSDPVAGRAAARDRMANQKRGADRGFRCAYPVRP